MFSPFHLHLSVLSFFLCPFPSILIVPKVSLSLACYWHVIFQCHMSGMNSRIHGSSTVGSCCFPAQNLRECWHNSHGRWLVSVGHWSSKGWNENPGRISSRMWRWNPWVSLWMWLWAVTCGSSIIGVASALVFRCTSGSRPISDEMCTRVVAVGQFRLMKTILNTQERCNCTMGCCVLTSNWND